MSFKTESHSREDDIMESNCSQFKELLHEHEQTILGNFPLIDVLEKEACTFGSGSDSRIYSRCPLNNRLLSKLELKNKQSKELSPIERIDISADSSENESPKSSKSPILSGPFKNKRKRKSLKARCRRMSDEGCELTSSSALVTNTQSGLNILSIHRKALDFSLPSTSSKLRSNTQGRLKTEELIHASDVCPERDEVSSITKGGVPEQEEERPWDYSVQAPKLLSQSEIYVSSKKDLENKKLLNISESVLKTPNSASRTAEESFSKQLQESSTKQELYPSLKGISRLASSDVVKSDTSPNPIVSGVSLIDWDESMCLDKESLSLSTPKSIPFSERFHRQLLNNNQSHITRPRQLIASTPAPEDTSFFGLPQKIMILIQKLRGIHDLYDWQKQCLSMPAVQQRCNLVYALPTSGGKTLVAEILLLKEILINRKNCLFILPYVSIVQEKVRALSQLAVELDFYVEEYAGGKGSYPPRKRRCKNSVYVATIEKAHGLVHSLIMEKRLHEIGLVVVDELHLLGEGSRGATLEAALSELTFAAERIQVVGMSATIGNLNDIAAFLNATTFTGNFRPVELSEYIKCGSTIYSINRNLIGTAESPLLVERTLFSDYDQLQLQKDPDQIGTLVGEVVPDGSCLIFCPSRKNCENVALLICETLPKSLLQIRIEEKKALYKALAAEGNGAVCPVLVKTLPFGVAYHHSGLTTAERRLLEEAFLANTICVICCTSTLAAGVNLPAKRVILRSPYVGTNFIDLSRYKQMVGRAGRTGFGETGESILMCHFQDIQKVLQLLTSSMTESLSCLAESDAAGMKALIMSSVSLAQATCRSDVYNLMKQTLLWVQAEKLGVSVVKLVDNCIMELVAEGAFCVDESPFSPFEETSDIILAPKPKSSSHKEEKQFLSISLQSKLSLSRVGGAAVKGSLSMAVALRLYDELRTAQEKLVLLNHMHLLYVVTPYSMSNQIKSLHQVYFNVYMALGPDELKAANAVGITEAVVFGLVQGRPTRAISREVIDRFYMTLILYDLWNEKSVWDVSMKYQVPRGQVHNLLVAASAFASSVLRFSEGLEEFWCYKALMVDMTERLSHCCSAELLPLMELPAVKIGRARQLYNAGFRTLVDIAKADPLHLVRELDHMPRKTAYQIVAAAKLLLIDKAEALREQASDVLEGIALHVGGGFKSGILHT